MKKIIIFSAVLSFFSGIASTKAYISGGNMIYYSLAVTFFTTFYHIAMRFAAAYSVKMLRKTKEDNVCFSLGSAERGFYEKIKLKKWKKYVPTYKKELFSKQFYSYREIMHNMTDAETGHIVIAILSFLPLAFSKIFDGFLPFFITSVIAAAFDMQFVAIQRFNKERVSRIIRKSADK